MSGTYQIWPDKPAKLWIILPVGHPVVFDTAKNYFQPTKHSICPVAELSHEILANY